MAMTSNKFSRFLSRWQPDQAKQGEVVDDGIVDESNGPASMFTSASRSAEAVLWMCSGDVDFDGAEDGGVSMRGEGAEGV